MGAGAEIEGNASVEELVRVIGRLRGENGCPWDRKQTPKSMRVYLIEEMYELVDAIDREDNAAIREELGDVLFQVLFVTRLFEEAGEFGLASVVGKNAEKMISRHPHVFGEAKVKDAGEVRERWHEFKKGEKNHKGKKLLDSVPRNLPALLRAYRVCERVSRVGFDACPGETPLAAAEEAFENLKGAADGAPEALATALGELLFALACFGHKMGVHPDRSLAETVNRFSGRFDRMEDQVGDLSGAPGEELRAIFDAASLI